MIPEQSFVSIRNRMQSVGRALEELLVTAQKQHCLTVGIYESAKLLNADSDSVVLCVLAADDADDVAVQIHFTLLQSFCCDSGITILRWQEFSGSSSCWGLRMPTETRESSETFTACWLRTLRPTTPGCKRWGPTARRVWVLTSGCLNWFCKNAEGWGTRLELSGSRG